MVAGTLLLAPAVVRKTPKYLDIVSLESFQDIICSIPNIRIAVESHNRKSNETQDHVEDDDRSTQMVFVASPASGIHDDSSKCVRWSDETLRCANGETHVFCQNDRQEIGKSVGDSCGVEEDLESQSRSKVQPRKMSLPWRNPRP